MEERPSNFLTDIIDADKKNYMRLEKFLVDF